MFLENFDLDKLLSPVSKEDFYDQYFGKQQLLIQRHQADYYQGLLTPTMLDDLLFHWPNLATVVKANKYEGRRQDMQGNVLQFNTATVLNELDEGNTLILDKLDNRLPSLTHMHALLEKETHYTFQSNIYVTPPSQQGFKAHFDDHHVFILQTQGKKWWRVNHQAENPNTPNEKALQQTIDENAHHAFMLEAGDLLYIPPFTVHEAAGQDAYSIHITLSPYPPTYRNVINHWLKDLSAEHPINKPLPFGYLTKDDQTIKQAAQDALAEVLPLLAEKQLTEFKDEQFNSLRGLFFGALAERIAPTSAQSDAQYQANRQLLMSIDQTDEQLTVKLPKKTATFPAVFAPAVLFCINSDRFKAHEIPNVSAEEAYILISRLLGEGLILKSD